MLISHWSRTHFQRFPGFKYKQQLSADGVDRDSPCQDRERGKRLRRSLCLLTRSAGEAYYSFPVSSILAFRRLRSQAHDFSIYRRGKPIIAILHYIIPSDSARRKRFHCFGCFGSACIQRFRKSTSESSCRQLFADVQDGDT